MARRVRGGGERGELNHCNSYEQGRELTACAESIESLYHTFGEKEEREGLSTEGKGISKNFPVRMENYMGAIFWRGEGGCEHPLTRG